MHEMDPRNNPCAMLLNDTLDEPTSGSVFKQIVIESFRKNASFNQNLRNENLIES